MPEVRWRPWPASRHMPKPDAGSTHHCPECRLRLPCSLRLHEHGMPETHDGNQLVEEKMAEFLTKEELEDMTGLTQPAAQRKHLEADGLRKGTHFFVRADGRLRVLRVALHARAAPASKSAPNSTQPNFSALPSLR